MPTTPFTRFGFQIIYDGAAMRDGLMSINDLAPALLALGHLVEQVNHRLNSENPPVQLQFRGAKRGSLIINLALQTTAMQCR